MRKSLTVLALFALTLGGHAAPAAAAQHVCLQATEIRSTSILDDRTILFRMNDGAQWKNILQADCPGLKMAGGFDYAIRADEICSNEQRIRVHAMPATCFLGTFAPVENK